MMKRITTLVVIGLQILDPPIGVPGFELAMIWHDRTATHPTQRWLRDRIVDLLKGV
jgi:DNA-binding transcriptional LysR family regulator